MQGHRHPLQKLAKVVQRDSQDAGHDAAVMELGMTDKSEAG